MSLEAKITLTADVSNAIKLLGDVADAIRKVADAAEKAGSLAGIWEGVTGTVEKVRGAYSGLAKEINELVVPLNELREKYVDAAEDAGRLAQSAGLTTEAFTQLAFGAEEFGVSQEAFSQHIGQLTRHLAEAQAGSAEARASFARLGLDPARFSNGERALLAVSEALSQMDDSAERSGAAVELFGKGAESLVLYLGEGREALAEAANQADLFGATIGTDTASAAAQLNSNVGILSKAFDNFFQGIANQAIPALTRLTELFVEWLPKGRMSQETAINIQAAVLTLAKGIAFVVVTVEALIAITVSLVKALKDLLMRRIQLVIELYEAWGKAAKALADTFKAVLKSVSNFGSIFADILSGNFGDAKRKFESLGADLGESSQEALDEIKAAANRSKGIVKDAVDIEIDGWKGSFDELVEKLTALGFKMEGISRDVEKQASIAPPNNLAPSPLHDYLPPKSPDPKTGDDWVKQSKEKLKELKAAYEQTLKIVKLQIELQQVSQRDGQDQINEATQSYHEKLKQITKELESQVTATRQLAEHTSDAATKASLMTKADQGDSAIGDIRVEGLSSAKNIKDTSFFGTMNDELSELGTKWQDLSGNMSETLTGGLKSALGGISDSITGLIDGTTTWGATFAKIGKQIISQIVSIVVQWIASMVVVEGLKALFRKRDKANAIEAAGDWAAPAALSTTASSGGTAIAGLAALLLVFAAVGSAISGFAEGGLTPGSASLAWVGERGPEFVVPADVVRTLGAANLHGMVKDARGGGGGGSTGGPSVGSKTGAGGVQVHNVFVQSMEAARRYIRSREGRDAIFNIMREEAQQG